MCDNKSINKLNPENEILISRYISWIDSEIANRYLNHKETMAWSATAGYLSVIVLANKASSYLNNDCLRFISTILLIFVCYLTYVFINMQFERRWIAADENCALRRCRTKLTKIVNYYDFSNFKLYLGDNSPATEIRLNSIGITTPSQLKKSDPEEIYEKLIIAEGGKLDRCVLYQLRGAILNIPWWLCKEK